MRLTCLIFLVLFSVPPVVDWTLKKKNDKTEVYIRKGSDGLNEIKVISNFNTTLEKVLTVLQDKDAYKDWVYGCSESRLLQKVSDRETIHYQRIKTPWPVNDRDLIIKTIINSDPEKRTANLTAMAVPDFAEVTAGVVRVRKYNAWWTITENPKGRVKIEYILSTDPAGMLPDWLVNMAVTEGPTQTMEKMGKMLEK